MKTLKEQIKHLNENIELVKQKSGFVPGECGSILKGGSITFDLADGINIVNFLKELERKG